MKYCFSIFFLLNLFCIQDAYPDNLDSAEYYYKKANFRKASEIAAGFLTVITSEHKPDAELIRAIDLLVEINDELLNDNTCISYVRRRLSINNKDPKKNRGNIFEDLLYLAQLYEGNHNFLKVDSLINEASKIAKGTDETSIIDVYRSNLLPENQKLKDKSHSKRTIRSYYQLISLFTAYCKEKDWDAAKEILIEYDKDLKKVKSGESEIRWNDISWILPFSESNYDYPELFEGCEKYRLDSLFRFAINYRQKLTDDPFSYFDNLFLFGESYESVNDFKSADSVYYFVKKNADSLFGPDNAYSASSLSYIADHEINEGNYLKARKLFDEALQIGDVSIGNNSVYYAYMLQKLLPMYENLGQLAEGRKICNRIRIIYEKELGTLNDFYSSLIYQQLIFYKNSDEREFAINLLTSLIAITEKNGVDCNHCYGNLLVTLAKIQEEEEDYANAEASYIHALEFLEKNISDASSNPYYVDFELDLARFYGHCRALDKQGELFHYPGEDRIPKNDKGSQILYQENGDTTLRFYTDYSVLDVFNNGIDFFSNYLGPHNPKVADIHFDKAIFSWTIHLKEGAQKEFKIALDEYLSQIKNVFPGLSEKEKTEFFNDIRENFDAYYCFVAENYEQQSTFLIQLDNVASYKEMLGVDTLNYEISDSIINYEGKPYLRFTPLHKGAIIDYRLATKAVILQSNKQIRDALMKANDPVLKIKYEEWEKNRQIIAKAYALSEKDTHKNDFNIDSLESRQNQLERDMSERSSKFKSGNDLTNARWTDVKAKLLKDEAAVEIIRIHDPLYYLSGKLKDIDSVYYLAVIIAQTSTPKYFLSYNKSPGIVVLKNGYDLENRYYKYYRNSILNKVEDTVSYNQFWKPVKESFRFNAKRIYISPDGVYNLINPVTLKSNQIFEYRLNNEIHTLTNLKDLLRQDQPQSGNPTSVLFGNPVFGNGKKDTVNIGTERLVESLDIDRLPSLPGAMIEANNVNSMLAGSGFQSNIYTGINATELMFKKTQSDVVHLATHGFFLENHTMGVRESPMLRSGLILAGDKDEKEDGILTAYEISNMDLSGTSLVVLSACQTGLGEVRTGEGVYGLQRAFIEAGVKNIIMSLWKVDDKATQKLMISFYSNWLKTKDVQSSLTAAQNEVRKEYPQPYYWGAFIALGK